MARMKKPTAKNGVKKRSKQVEEFLMKGRVAR